MAGTQVQNQIAETVGGSITSQSDTLAAPATAGNLLITAIAIDKSSGTITVPSGYTLIGSTYVSANISGALAYKKAVGGEDLTDWNWVTAVTGGATMWLAEYSGIDTLDVQASDDSGVGSVTTQSSGTTGTTTDADARAFAVFGADTFASVNAGRSYSNSFVEIGVTPSEFGVAGLMVAELDLSATGTQETAFSTTDTGDQMFGKIAVFKLGGGGITGTIAESLEDVTSVASGIVETPAGPADIDFYLSGNPADTTFSVKLRSPSGTATALEYSVNSNFTSSVTTSTQTGVAGSDFILEFNLTGLTANTQYYFRGIEDSTTDTNTGKFRTFEAKGTAQSMTIAFASCAETGSTSAVFDRIRNKDPDMFVHMGDLHYEDITVNDVATYRTAFKDTFASSTQNNLYRNVPLAYMWDDHDYADNNSGASATGRPAARSTIREYIPQTRDNGSGSVEYSFDVGRVRFLVPDLRSERAGSTLMGATQLTAFKSALTSFAADSDLELCIFVSTVPWIATAVTDTWSDATAERTEISDLIHSLGIKNQICTIGGDAHMLAADDGSNNTFDTNTLTGWPVYQSASMDRTPSVKGGPYSEGTFSAGTGQYSILTITDAGGSITVESEGFNSSDVGQYTHSFITGTAITGTVAETLDDVTAVGSGTVEGLPVITRIGAATVQTLVGVAYNDLGATALDEIDGDITGDIVTVNPVNINVLGPYVVTYNVSDSSANDAVEVTRTVNVVDELSEDSGIVVSLTQDLTQNLTGELT